MAIKSKKTRTKSSKQKKLPLSTPAGFFQSKIFGRLLMSIGALLITGTIFLTQMAYITPDYHRVVLSKESSSDIYPVSINISELDLLHIVEKGNFKQGLWPLSDSQPVYLDSSGTPGKLGNIVIYGHNTKKVFGELDQLKEGSVVTLTTNSSLTFSYKIDSIKKVFPQDVEILEQGIEERLTLFTCTGLFDSMRLVVSGTRVL